MKRNHGVKPMIIALLLLTGIAEGQQSTGDGRDLRSSRLQDADHFRWELPDPFPSRSSWQERARELRLKLLISTGLWPEPAKTPLNARVFSTTQGNGFKVAKAYFESLPGFFVTGNLYLPQTGSAPYPAILTTHGHWNYGRLQNGESGSIPGRCIDFARQGYVVLSIDMIGYLDSFQLPHDGSKSRAELQADRPLPYEPRQFRADFDFPEADLYGVSLAGFQLWNAIRALDFLVSLPDVDASRIGMTGASGGATQTILLMAADDRVKVAAPVNIIGAEKHPGCLCENPPALWVDTSTIELVASFAPRPLLLVSATEDPWTHSTPTREFPMLRRYYRLFGAENQLENVHVDAGHNYNAASRAAVYNFFRKHLHPSGPPIDQPDPVSREVAGLGDLRVFPDKLLPEGARSGRRILSDWQQASEKSLKGMLPKSPAELAPFAARMREALSLLLNVRRPDPSKLEYSTVVEESREGWILKREMIGRRGRQDWVELESLRRGQEASGAVLLVVPEAFGPLQLDSGIGSCFPWIRMLAERGFEIFRVRGYASGALRIPDSTWMSYSWPRSYNRGNQLEAVQDIVTALESVRQVYPTDPLLVAGLDSAGLVTALAAAIQGGADRVVIDLNGEDPNFDGTLTRLLPIAGLRRLGDLRTALLLDFPGSVRLVNPGPSLDVEPFREMARGVDMEDRLAIEKEMLLTDPGFSRVFF